MSDTIDPELSALLHEDRVFEPPAEFRANAIVKDAKPYEEAERDPRRILGPFCIRARMEPQVDQRARLEQSAAREVVRRRPDQRVGQLCRSSHSIGAPQQSRSHLGRGARRSPHADLLRSLSPGQRVCECAQVARRQEGRSRRHLHAARARAGDRDARMRAHRRAAQHRLRRIQRRLAARSHERRAMHAADHRRRRISPRCDRAIEEGGIRSARWGAVRGEPHHAQAACGRRCGEVRQTSRRTARHESTTGTS